MVDRKVESNRPRVVVDGIDDLRDSFTGLLARRLKGIDDVPDTRDMKKGLQDDFLATNPMYDSFKSQLNPIDDRITPQTLHVLLRNNRNTITKLHPPSMRKKYYSFTANVKGSDNNALLMDLEGGGSSSGAEQPKKEEEKQEKSSPLKSERRKTLKKSRMVVKGDTPGEFMKRTGCPKPETDVPLHLAPRKVEFFDQYAYNAAKEAQENDIHHMEGPTMALANTSKYFSTARDEEAAPDGIGIDIVSVPLSPQPPVEPCVSYPPIPVRYATKEDEKRALSLKRLAPRGGVKPESVVTEAPVNEHVAVFEENERRGETLVVCDDGRTPEQAQQLEYAFTTAARGEDSNFIERLVKGYCADKQKSLQLSSKRTQSATLSKKALKDVAEGSSSSVYPAASDIFSLLDTTLSVSREFEKIKCSEGSSHGLGWTISSDYQKERREAVEKLTAFSTTRIPEQYWVSIQERRLRARQRAEGKAEANTETIEEEVDEVPLEEFSHLCNGSYNNRRHADVSILFPATHPVGRAQVYLLAETLDFMLNESKDLLNVLSDPTVAKQILPVDTEARIKAIEDGLVVDELTNPLLVPLVQEECTEAHRRYTAAAKRAIEVLDIGMVELIRQVGAICVERGALLNGIRQSMVDVASSNIKVLEHAKEVAFQEASMRCMLRQDISRLQEESRSQKRRIHELEKENEKLGFSNESLQLKATRIDLLMERIEAKRKRYELHSEDEHECLLLELEEEMIKTASKVMTALEKGEEDDELGTNTTEAPTAAVARKRVWDAKTAMSTLYSESCCLLKELDNTTCSVNTACAPLYEKVALGKLSPNTNVATAKWVAIARAIGEFEKEKTHRQRVFQVFTEWCDRFRKEKKDDSELSPTGGGFLVTSSSDVDQGDSLLDESAASFMSLSSMERFAEEEKRKIRKKKRNAGEKDKEESTKELLTQIHYITREDLVKMSVFDCSPDEVNAMFERKFDFKTFLHTPWEPSTNNFTLNLRDIADMVHDLRVFLQEVTIRMRAISSSAVMMKGIEPPLMPPAHPDIPCPLCARREMTGEKKKRQDALQNIAREVQSRIEELTRRFQKAESEREDAKSEVRRIQQEVEAATEREEGLKQHLNEMIRQRELAQQQPQPPKWNGDRGGGGDSIASTKSIIKGSSSVRLPNSSSRKVSYVSKNMPRINSMMEGNSSMRSKRPRSGDMGRENSASTLNEASPMSNPLVEVTEIETATSVASGISGAESVPLGSGSSFSSEFTNKTVDKDR